MESSSSVAMASPSSDERLWGNLHDRVGTILERQQHRRPRRCSSSLDGAEWEGGKRFREDSVLLIRGLDSAAASLSQLTDSLNAAQKGLHDLAKPSLTSLQRRENSEAEEEDAQPNAKRRCGPGRILSDGGDEAAAGNSQDEAPPDRSEEADHAPVGIGKSGNLKKAKNLAISMASRASLLARELKTMKSELLFTRERCALLEEENRRLREGAEEGDRPEEDDLVRLQMEALLAEKSRLANENANLTRENQCLHQLVEYHQLATQDPSSPLYEQTIDGICLDFSSPEGHEEDDDSNHGETRSISTPDKLGVISSLDEEH
ncbi:uncharacterized protein A4U43_C04F33580 [Asparagus officinalis]|uniref:Uncharacterized protein n=1 Tax=Asparagus officinalis TaxID=4686 RepID=A0A5P1F5G9_ASPOF|nr:uncharacterized protein LOC109839531 [Asparagus officinalis]ONK73626.1 uncharacterized protein A4U43_C04F33580 [Asparagus officinalis]